MKQKKIGTDLWVFDTSAYQITKDTDSSVIYIQGECMKEFKAVNSSTLYPKMKEYNYKTLLAQKPSWGDYIYADEEKQDVSAVWKWDTGTEIDPPIIVKGINEGSNTAAFECQNRDTQNPVDNSMYEILNSSICELKNQSGVLSVTGKDFGETKVKATWAEDSSYNAGSSEIAVKVSPIINYQFPGEIPDYILDGGEIVIGSDITDESAVDVYISYAAGHNFYPTVMASSDTGVAEINIYSDEIYHLVYKGLGKCTVNIEWAQVDREYSAGSASFDVSTYAA